MVLHSHIVYSCYIIVRKDYTVPKLQEHLDNIVGALAYSEKDGCSVFCFKTFGM
jgi:hypothetical protein